MATVPESDAAARAGRTSRCGKQLPDATGNVRLAGPVPPRAHRRHRPWAFGDTEPWNVTRTPTNAVLRDAGKSRGARELGHPHHGRRRPRSPRPKTCSQAAVALLVDTSFSMVMENRWLPMKRTAPGAEPSRQHPFPFGCVADHRFWPACPDLDGRGADRPGGRLRAGHESASRALARSAPATVTRTRSRWC